MQNHTLTFFLCFIITSKSRSHDGSEDTTERGKRKAKQLVRSPKKRRPNKSPEKVTKTEKSTKEITESKSDTQKSSVQEKESTVVTVDSVAAVVKPQENTTTTIVTTTTTTTTAATNTTTAAAATTIAKEKIEEVSTVEAQVMTDSVVVAEVKTPTQGTSKCDENPSMESFELRLSLSPEHSAESGSGKFYFFLNKIKTPIYLNICD